MLVDSNILVYAINKSSPKHKLAQKFLVENKNKLLVAHQNILETLRILTHPKYPNPMEIDKALEAVLKIVEALNVIYPQFETQHLVIELIKKYKLKSDQVFDGYIVATMLTNGINKIATDNERDFKRIIEIKVINPFN